MLKPAHRPVKSELARRSVAIIQFFPDVTGTWNLEKVDRLIDTASHPNLGSLWLDCPKRRILIVEGLARTVNTLLNYLGTDAAPRNSKVLHQVKNPSNPLNLQGTKHLDGKLPDVATAIDMLASGDLLRINIGLEFLRQTITQNAQKYGSDIADADAAALKLTRFLDDSLQRTNESQRSGLIRLLLIVSLAIAIDISLFTNNPDLNPGLLHKIYTVYAYTLIGMALSAVLVKSYKLLGAQTLLYATAIATVAAQSLWVGFGMSAATIPYLTLTVMIESFGPRSRFFCMALLTAITLLGLTIAGMALSGSAQFIESPAHHQALGVLMLPFAAFLIGKRAVRERKEQLSFSSRIVTEQLTLIERLRRTMQAREKFFAAISHEIRTPLNGMQTSITLIEHPKVGDEARKRYLGTLQQAIKNLTTIVDDLLDLSRLESGGFPLLNHEIDLDTFCQQIKVLAEPLVTQYENVFNYRILSEGDNKVIGDPVRLTQMVSNLTYNAAKFTKAGTIDLLVERQTSVAGRSQWCFSVSDTGCGIKAADLPNLFKPFSQADNQINAAKVGAGLGLSVVAALAKQMDGTVGVSSEEGRGSRFWFTVILQDADLSEKAIAERNLVADLGRQSR